MLKNLIFCSRFFLQFIGYALLCCVLFGCAEEKQVDYPSSPQRESRMTAKERAEQLPNSLFVAVLNEDVNQIDEILRTEPGLLGEKNIEFGETPLGFAIRKNHQSIALRLLQAMPRSEHFVVNNNGESYVLQAARSGHSLVIQELARQLFDATPSTSSYVFAELDVPDLQGRVAHFVAKNSMIIELLYNEYHRNTLRFWRSFYNLTDNKSRSFLHWAAVENRHQVITWAAGRYCHPVNHAENSYWNSFKRQLLSLGRSVAFQIGDITGNVDVFFNREDDDGRTALHLAAETQRLAALDALMSCPWLNPEATDELGNTALHLFLKNLDVRNSNHTEQVKSVFRRLVSFTNCQLIRCYGKESLLEKTNQDLDAPAHFAARLADPSFYDHLQEIRMIMLPNSSNQTPVQIRHSRQAELRTAKAP